MLERNTLTNLANRDPALVIRDMGMAYAFSQALYVAATLGIADLVAASPTTAVELAKATNTHAPSLYRVLRLLAGAGVFVEREDGRFALTPAAGCLRRDVPGSMRQLITLWGAEEYRAFGDLIHSVKTGLPAFDHAYGMGIFQYLSQNPAAGKIFNEALTEWGGQNHAAVVKAYGFSGFRKIIDVGGGHGALITTILKANPHLRGVLFDQPSVVEGGKGQIEAAGLTDRCEAVGGDFFDFVPAGADVCCLSLVIHDWDDDQSLAILKNCRRALPAGATLLLLEVLVGPRNEPDWGKISDVYMLVLTSGRERTVAEYGALLADAGFKLTKTVPTESVMTVIEGIAV